MTVEYARRGLIGLLTPQANTTVEPEFGILMPAGFAHVNARLLSRQGTIKARLAEYFVVAAQTARQFSNAPVRALALACTGSSYLAGREREAALLSALTDEFGVPAFTAASAVVDALCALGARRIALASPYPPALTQASVGYWQSQGFEVTAVAELAEPAKSDAVTAEPAPFHPIYALSADTAGGLLTALARRTDTDAVLMLGTGMPTLAPLLAANAGGTVPVLSCMLCLGWKAVDVIEPGALPLAGWMTGTHWSARLAEHTQPVAKPPSASRS